MEISLVVIICVILYKQKYWGQNWINDWNYPYEKSLNLAISNWYMKTVKINFKLYGNYL